MYREEVTCEMCTGGLHIHQNHTTKPIPLLILYTLLWWSAFWHWLVESVALHPDHKRFPPYHITTRVLRKASTTFIY